MDQMTWAEINASVLKNCKRTDDTDVVAEKVQAAVDFLVDNYNFPKLEKTGTVDTADGIPTTALPDQFKEFYDDHSVTLHETGEKQHLEILSKGDFFEAYPKPDEDSEDVPRKVTIWENSLVWYPIPDDAYTIRIRFRMFHGAFDVSNVTHSLERLADNAIIACLLYTSPSPRD